MTSFVPYINGLFTLTENVFNVLGYLPKDQFPKLNALSEQWRTRFGLLQAVIGVALCALSLLAESLKNQPDSRKYLSTTQQMFSLGLLYLNHGTFNIIRAYIEGRGYGFITAAYDFYGRKFLPALAEPFDVQGILFEKIRRQLDRILFITIIPPNWSIKSFE